MKGAISGGSTATVNAGGEILRVGGNAVDAVVASVFAMAAGEPTLTSLAGGGIMIHRDGITGDSRVLDFFANAPGLDRVAPDDRDFFPLDLVFGPAVQRFHIGAGAAGVPGVIPGLCTALELWGTMPLEEVLQPACRLLREGAVLEPMQERAVEVLRPILTYTENGRAQFGVGDRLLRTGDLFRLEKLADVLSGFTSRSWREAYRELFCAPMVAQFGPESGGLITGKDLERYEPIQRRPVSILYRGCEINTNPPPAAGGEMIGMMLRLLEGEPVSSYEPGGAAHVHALCRAMRLADEARREDNGYSKERFRHWRDRFNMLRDKPLAAGPEVDGGPPSTTHVSVVDSAGNGAGVTVSHGEGNGILIGDTGVMMNNLMGEEDLFPHGFDEFVPGTRLTTMMSPTVVRLANGDVTVMGTGGANRIRTALVQTICAMVDFERPAGSAVKFPRVHFEAGVLNAETFDRPGGGTFLAGMGAAELVEFEEPNLFFGGVHLVKLRPDNSLAGAGDPRRGGTCLLVEG